MDKKHSGGKEQGLFNTDQNVSYQGILSQVASMAHGTGPMPGKGNGLSTVIQGLTDFLGAGSGLPNPSHTPDPKPDPVGSDGVNLPGAQSPESTTTTAPASTPTAAAPKMEHAGPNPKDKPAEPISAGGESGVGSPDKESGGHAAMNALKMKAGDGIIGTLVKMFTAGFGG